MMSDHAISIARTTRPAPRRFRRAAAAIAAAAVLAAAATSADAQVTLTPDLSKAFAYRAVGPARQCGRILHIAGHPTEPYTFYFAPGTGGLWKTVNNGTTFETLLPGESNVPVGHFALAPSDPDVIWAGTGDAASGRIPIRGEGVYKSTDGGRTWSHVGLEATRHIGRVAVHPSDPDTVYVAAVGYHFSFNPERGVYKTTDGGRAWAKVLDLGEKIGFVEVLIRPDRPEIVFAASYDKPRIPWNFDEAGPGSAIYKSEDAGATWRKLAGGLPGGRLGRIGLAAFAKDPDIMYATIDNYGMRPPTEEEAKRDRAAKREPQERQIGAEVYRSDDGGETWVKTNKDGESIGGGKWYGQIYVDPNDDKVVYVPNVFLLRSLDGGRTWGRSGPENLAPSVHVDHHAIWIDPSNSRRILLGHDGGLAQSYDFGVTWDAYMNLPLAQYYAVGVDLDEPYNIYGGLQDNGSVKFPSNGLSGKITADDWTSVGGGDGMVNVVDPTDSRWLYNSSQHGAIQRVDQRTGQARSIRPRPAAGRPAFRFNWTAPIHLSPHNPSIIYLGAQVLLRSLNRGDDWREISPDLTTNDPVKLKGNIEFCTLTTISESPLEPGLIWTGSDDGVVQVTRNGGGSWADVTPVLAAAGAPAEHYVTRVAASRHAAGTAYVTKAGWHRDDYRPFVFKTDDFGATWTNATGNLPEGTVYSFAEDPVHPGLLMVGTERSVFASLDGGGSWTPFGSGLPAFAIVNDLLIHPRDGDLVVATHGRGVFITDIAPLREMRGEFGAEGVHLFALEPAILWTWRRSGVDSWGDRHWTAPNEPQGVAVRYYLKADAARKPKIRITTPYGEEVAALEGPGSAGIQTVNWDMTRQTGAPAPEGGGARFRRRPTVDPGEYVVILEAGGKTLRQTVRLRPMPER